jgi:hypothetical protein
MSDALARSPRQRGAFLGLTGRIIDQHFEEVDLGEIARRIRTRH